MLNGAKKQPSNNFVVQIISKRPMVEVLRKNAGILLSPETGDRFWMTVEFAAQLYKMLTLSANDVLM